MTAFALPLASPLSSAGAWLKGVPGMRYWAAALLVLACFGVRLLLSPFVTAGFGFTCFYPAVILSAYWLGGRPGLMAAGLSTLIVVNFMWTAPFQFEFRFQTDGRAVVALGFFLFSSLLLIHVLSAIRSRFADLETRHARVEALASGQAELFREHAQRTTDHLQLISAILQVRARDERDPLVARVLTNAASRTLVISRTHRAFATGEERQIPFEDFARKLVEASAARGGLPAAQIRIVGGALDVPLEHATALGLILLDYLNALQEQSPAAALAVVLAENGDQRTLNLIAACGDQAAPPGDMPLFEAVCEQLGGRLSFVQGVTGCDVRITFPAQLQAPPAWRPLAFNLH
jgi:hypothetical protein